LVITRYLLTLILATFPLYSVATEKEVQKWYQIELIIFKQPQPAVASSENEDDWNNKKIAIDYSQSIDIHYPQRKVLNEDGIYNEPPENNAEVISLKEAETMVAESLRPEQKKQPQLSLQPFTFSVPSKWELGEVYERLNNSNQYQQLIHTAWIQPGLNKSEAIPAHIYDHMALNAEDENDPLTINTLDTTNLIKDKELPPVDSVMPATSYPIESNSFNLNDQKNDGQNLLDNHAQMAEKTFEGTIKVTLARYLHVDINLDYAPQGFPLSINSDANELMNGVTQIYSLPTPSVNRLVQNSKKESPSSLYDSSNLDNAINDHQQTEKRVYRLQESRRMRSNELHYLDHPLIGVLVKIVPVEIPKENIDSGVSPDKS